MVKAHFSFVLVQSFAQFFPVLLALLKDNSLFMMPLQEFVSVWVRDPRIQKEDFWHSYIDYEICIHVSMKSVEIVILRDFYGIHFMG